MRISGRQKASCGLAWVIVSLLCACCWQDALAGQRAAAAAGGRRGAGTAAGRGAIGELLQGAGANSGLCVVLEGPRCQRALELARRSELLIYMQFPRAADTAAARRAVDEAGHYGTRIWIEHGPLDRLYLADNLADTFLAVGSGAAVPEAEVLRVLRPQGRARVGDRTVVKPVPAGADDWSHPYHSANNNPASRDQIARGPYLTQFLADPRYAPLPQVAVAAAGRVFKLFGHIAFKEREEPWLNTLAAFNGYNGAFLWRRPIPDALMVHRSTIIATPELLYFGDDASCKIIDAATGQLRDEIVVAEEGTGGTFWKWMGMEDGTLLALIGEQEERDPVIRMRSDRHGWPWDPLSPGYNQPEHTWGYGRTLVAIDPATKQVLWRHHEPEPIDSRAVCAQSGRLFIFRFGAYLACLDSKTGAELWRKTPADAPELFASLGDYLNRQDWRTNWRTAAYAKCSDKALYFSGPPVGRLLAVAAEDGRFLWQHPYDNYQLVLLDDGLYGLSGQIDQELSRKFDPLTGAILAEFALGRRACARPTGAIDAVFCRASGGSTRLGVEEGRPELVSPMRAQCHDGVTIANGLLYWWPSVCDCNLTLYGITCLGPAGDFEFSAPALEAQRLEGDAAAADVREPLAVAANDWPTFRANNRGTVTTEAVIPAAVRQLWRAALPSAARPTPPTAAGGLVFLGGADGIVRALDARSGEAAWKAYTGGELRLPPTIADGRAVAGSGDGWVYCFEARTGRRMWRFRAAPAERRIPVYGQLLSTWPAASGVLVDKGVAYVAAGIANYDGTHVYALDLVTGAIRWQNNSSGHLDPDARTGVGVQGHMLLHDGKLYLAGGNAVSPGIYDIADGTCLSDPGLVHRVINNNVPASESPRGWELYQIGDRVLVSGKPYYAHPRWGVYDASVLNKTLLASAGERDVVWVNNAKLMAFGRAADRDPGVFARAWGKPEVPGLDPVWERPCEESLALAVCRNAAVVATAGEVVALDLASGRQLWSEPIPAAPVPWGLAVDRDGRVILALENGEVLCFGDAAEGTDAQRVKA